MSVRDLTEGGVFGRRKGHKLRAGQEALIAQVLPALRVPEGDISDPADLFARPVREVRLEIGFGGGEHLLAGMQAEPDIGFIGCEPFVNGMAKFLAQVGQNNDVGQDNLSNIRVHDGDATTLLRRLPQASLAGIDLLYPDPWPKRRQRKRRFVSPERLELIARALKPGALFRFASDIDDYVAWTLARIEGCAQLSWTATCADDWRKPWPGWVSTRYEAKAFREGRLPSYLIFKRI